MSLYYQDELVTLYHGDCREVVARVAAKPDMLLADPPYGLNHSGSYESRFGRGKRKTYGPVIGDDQPFDPAAWLGYPKVVLWGANRYADRLPPSPGWLIWDKREHTPANDFADAELAWCSFPTPARIFRHYWNGPVRASERGVHLHPTQKPVALMSWIIDRWTKHGNLILDPFSGSGPVLLAAKNLGRRAIGVEIEERYCEIAAKRLDQGVLDFGESA